MSCYNNKGNYNYFASKTSSGYKYFGFIDTITQPETIAVLLRNFLSDSTNSVKRRAFQMFMMINQYTSSKPDLTGGMLKEYSLIVDAIFKPFIDGYGKYNPSINYNKELNIIRLKVSQYLKQITGCGDVNIIFKSYSATPVTDEINCYINDLNTSFGSSFNYSVDNGGLKLDSTSTITISIPLRFIDNTISSAYNKAIQNFNKNGIKLTPTDEKIISAVRSNIDETATKKLYKSLICALYKEQIFNKFAQDVVTLSKYYDKSKIEDTAKVLIQIDTRNTTPSLNLKSISSLLKMSNIVELNPHILLDIFEIYDGEMNLFIKNFIRDDSNSSIFSPNYAYLQVDHDDYVDEESRISASIVYVTKLNYCIIALMLLTKNSIKESNRSYYNNMIKNSLSYIRSASKITYITNNKDNILKEIEFQLNIMTSLASNIIKLKRFSEGLV